MDVLSACGISASSPWGRFIRLMIGDFLGLPGPIAGPESAPLGADYVSRAVDLLSNLLIMAVAGVNLFLDIID